MAQKTSIQNAIVRIWNLLRLDKRDISAIYILSILASLVSLSLPLGIQSIIGFLMGGSYSTSIVVLVGLVVFGTFINGLLQIRQLQLIEKIEQKIFVRYALEFGDRIPNFNIEKLDAYYLPELVNRFFDLPILQKSLQKLFIEIPPAIFQIILGTILLSFYHPLFIAFGFLLLLSVFLIIRFTSAEGFRTSMEASDYKYQLAAWFQELARNIKVFKYGADLNYNLKKTDDLSQKYVETKTRHFRVLSVQYWALVSFKFLITAAMLIFGVILLLSQRINIGQFIASDIVILAIIASVEKLISSMDLVYESLTSIEKLHKVTQAEIETSGKLEVQQSNKSMALECIDLSYVAQDQFILKGVNFKLEPGQWLNAFGEQGSGKSFLLNILAGSFTDFTGIVLVDSMPLRNYDLRNYRSKLGILVDNQDVFKGSLLQNLCLDDDSLKKEHIIKICSLVGLNDFIKQTNLGLDTAISPEDKKLTAKTKHQIVLARSLVYPSNLYLFENPFQYLNIEEKSNVLDFLKNTGATVVFTSKEPDSNCDVLLNLN
jgi:ATP-binding cassette, subfamily B, bacterial